MKPTAFKKFNSGLQAGNRHPYLVSQSDLAQGLDIHLYPLPETGFFIPPDLQVNAPWPLSMIILDTSLRERGLVGRYYRYVPAHRDLFTIAHYLYLANEYGSDPLAGYCETLKDMGEGDLKRGQIRDLVASGINSYKALVENHREYLLDPFRNPIKEILSRLPEESESPSFCWWTLWWI